MKPTELQTKLTKISEVVDRLADENEKLKKQLSERSQLIDEAILQLEQKEEELKSFHNQLNMTKLANGFVMGDEEKKALRLEINAIVREVDKCLAFLKDG